MSNELSLRTWMSFAKGGSAAHMDSGVLSLTVSGTLYQLTRQTIGTAEEALKLGEVAPAGGYFYCINRDITNYVQLKGATGGAVTVMLQPGDACMFRWDVGVTAPFAQAHTAACDIEFLLLPA